MQALSISRRQQWVGRPWSCLIHWFHLREYVNSQICTIWSTENHHVLNQQRIHSKKITVWCAVSCLRTVGYSFLGTTVNSVVYHDIIKLFISLIKTINGILVPKVWCRMSQFKYFKVVFLANFSPDFFSLGFAFYLKGEVYTNRPLYLNELKKNIPN